MAHDKAWLYLDQEQYFANIFRCLGHPARIRILLEIRKQPLTLAQIDDNQPINYKTVYHHVRMLLKAGLIEPMDISNASRYKIVPDRFINSFLKIIQNHNDPAKILPPKWFLRSLPSAKSFGENNFN